MIKFNSLPVVFALLASLTNCNAQSVNGQKSIYSDTSLFKLDTVLTNVAIGNKQFSIKILRDKFDEHLEGFMEDGESSFSQSPITVVIENNTDNKVVYIKKFDSVPNDYPYLNYSFHKGQGQSLAEQGKLYLMIDKNYGGSGSISVWYYIDFKNGKIKFNSLFDSGGELTYVAYQKNDNEILVLDGIWNMKENEGHFANHRYSITKFAFKDGYFQKTEIGKSKLKYSSLDEDKTAFQILTEMKAKEPLLLKSINIAGYK